MYVMPFYFTNRANPINQYYFSVPGREKAMKMVHKVQTGGKEFKHKYISGTK